MREADISKAMADYLLTMPGRPPVYWRKQEVPVNQAPPYLQVEMVRIRRQNIANDGTDATSSLGFMQVSVVTNMDATSVEDETIADAICAHFPKALQIPGVGGIVTITDEPDVKPGFREANEDWRVPVQVEYAAI